MCAVCPDDTPWPCPPARVQLGEAYGGDRLRLVVDLAAMMRTALEETDVNGGDLYERFILWTRSIPGRSVESRPNNGGCQPPDAPMPARRPWWHRRRI